MTNKALAIIEEFEEFTDIDKRYIYISRNGIFISEEKLSDIKGNYTFSFRISVKEFLNTDMIKNISKRVRVNRIKLEYGISSIDDIQKI